MGNSKIQALLSECRKKLKRLEEHDLMQRPPATVEVNAPVALMQMAMEGRISALKWVISEGEKIEKDQR